MEDSSGACISAVVVSASFLREAEWFTFGIMVNRSRVRSGSILSSKSDSGAVAVVGVAILGVLEGTVTVGLR